MRSCGAYFDWLSCQTQQHRACGVLSLRIRDRPHYPASGKAMKHWAVFFVLLAMFVLGVGSRFKPSDGEALAAIARITRDKIRNILPDSQRFSRPLNELRNLFPESLSEKVQSRLMTDQALAGADITVLADGSEVKLRGVVANADARRRAIDLAQSTVGVQRVVDEMAYPIP